MLNSHIVQNNLAALNAASNEHDKIKNESNKKQQTVQNKIDGDVKTQNRAVTEANQDSNPQKVLEQEEEGKEKRNAGSSQEEKHEQNKRKFFKDKNKGNIVDIVC